MATDEELLERIMRREAKLADPENIPWNYPGIHFAEGRYYYGLFFFGIRNFIGPDTKAFMPHGGDLMGILWRFKTDELQWILTHRLRINADRGDPFEERDEKIWKAARFAGNEPAAVAWVAKHCGFDILGLEGGVADWIVYQTENQEEIMEKNKKAKKPWMHIRSIKVPNPES